MSKRIANRNGSPFISVFCLPLPLVFILILFLPRTGISGTSAWATEFSNAPGNILSHYPALLPFVSSVGTQDTIRFELTRPRFAIMYSHPLALVVMLPEKWSTEVFYDGDIPSLSIFPADKKQVVEGRMFFPDSMVLQILNQKQEVSLEKMFEEESNRLISSLGTGEPAPREVLVSASGLRFVRGGVTGGKLRGRFSLAYALCGDKIIKMSAIASPEFVDQMEKTFIRVASFLLPFRFEKVDSRGAIYPATDPSFLTLEQEIRNRYLNFDAYRSWAAFEAETELCFGYRARSSSILYALEKTFSLLAVDDEVAVLEYKEKGEVKNLSSQEKLPPANQEKVLELMSGIIADEASNPYYVSLGPNPLLFLNSDSSLVTSVGKDKVAVGGKEIETEKVDFYQATGGDEQRATFWLSEEVPGYLVKASASIAGHIITAGAYEPVEFIQEIELKSFRPVLRQEKEGTGPKQPASAPGEIPALYYLQRKLTPGDYSLGLAELQKLKILFYALNINYEDTGLKPKEILTGLEPVVQAVKRIRDKYAKVLEEARADLEEESFQSIYGVINRIVASTDTDIKALELQCQLIGSKNQSSERNAELASKINREMIQMMVRSLSSRDDFQNALRALQGVTVKYKKKK